MECQKCEEEFEEKDIQLSHDVPKYIGGTDKDGRHNLCKKCHDIYEGLVFYVIVKDLPEPEKVLMRSKAKRFASRWLKKEGEDVI